MYDRMLDKTVQPTAEQLAAHCGENAERFILRNSRLSQTLATTSKIVFPYGYDYGWGVAHKKKQRLICNVFAEIGAFTVMMRLSNAQCESVYGSVSAYTQEYLDNKYPCGDGGWIHYRVTCGEHMRDIEKLLLLKCK